MSYEFMAPISEFGEPQYAYWMIKALADFCRENEYTALATMLRNAGVVCTNKPGFLPTVKVSLKPQE